MNRVEDLSGALAVCAAILAAVAALAGPAYAATTESSETSSPVETQEQQVESELVVSRTGACRRRTTALRRSFPVLAPKVETRRSSEPDGLEVCVVPGHRFSNGICAPMLT